MCVFTCDVRLFSFSQMLATVFNIIFFEDCRNQWSMSRPLLPLILVNEDVSCHVEALCAVRRDSE